MQPTPQQLHYRELWFKALESGEYPQCKSVLSAVDANTGAIAGHCCLGVAAQTAGLVPDILNPDYGDPEEPQYREAAEYTFSRNDATFTRDAETPDREWFTERFCVDKRISGRVISMATTANDAWEYDFAKIADMFRKFFAEFDSYGPGGILTDPTEAELNERLDNFIRLYRGLSPTSHPGV